MNGNCNRDRCLFHQCSVLIRVPSVLLVAQQLFHITQCGYYEIRLRKRKVFCHITVRMEIGSESGVFIGRARAVSQRGVETGGWTKLHNEELVCTGQVLFA